MGLFRTTPKSVPKSETKVVTESPHKKICAQMAEDSKIFALYSKDGELAVDHFGRAGGGRVNVAEAFYLAMNLNFIHYFGNRVQVGLYCPQGLEMLSPTQASFKPVYQLGEDAVVHTNSKEKGFKVNLTDYEQGILLMTLRLPKEWSLPDAGQLRVKLQSSLLFNPTEMDTFLLKLSI